MAKKRNSKGEKGTATRSGQIGLYRSGISSPERLEATTVAREELLQDLLEKLGRSAKKKTHQHYIFIGPRGVGKTHLLSLLVHRVETSKKLSQNFTIVRFAQEIHRLLSFADFLLRICESLAQDDEQSLWQALYEELSEEDDDQHVIDILEPKLKGYRREYGKTLLLLVENLDEILTRQIKDEKDIHHLRSFLLTSPSCILVATAPTIFPGLTDVKQPLYDFFDMQMLHNLSQEETLDAIRANLDFDKRQDLLDRFGELSPKIKALHEMTGGNPRLVMMHYSLIVDDDILDVKEQFEELLDKISPFYQDRIKDLPPQERAVLETMALIRTKPKTPALIARKLRKSPQQTSSLLQRLTKSGYLVVMDNPDDKRSKIYRIREGFFDIWLSMNKSRKQRKRLPALTEFFEMWYERHEREQKRRDLIDQLLAEGASADEKHRSRTTLDYLSDAGTDDEKITAKLRTARAVKESGLGDDAAAYLDEVKVLQPRGVIGWLTNHSELWASDSPVMDPIRQIEDWIDCWESQRAGQLEEFAARLFQIGKKMQGAGLHAALAELFISSLVDVEDLQARGLLLQQAAMSQQIAGDLNNAAATLQIALKLAKDAEDTKLEAMTCNGMAKIHYLRGDYDQALKYLEQSLAINRETGDRSGEGVTRNNISQIHHDRGDFDRALRYLEQSLAISREVGDRSGEGTTINNISQIYIARGDYDAALKYLEQSLPITREVGDRTGESVALHNISHIFHDRGDYGRALTYLEQSLVISREVGDRAGEGSAFNNISQVYYMRGDYDRALKYLEQSLLISRETGHQSSMYLGLYNLGRLHQAMKQDEAAMASFLAAYKVAEKIGDPPSLKNMDKLAKELGHEEGLAYWESLSDDAPKKTDPK